MTAFLEVRTEGGEPHLVNTDSVRALAPATDPITTLVYLVGHEKPVVILHPLSQVKKMLVKAGLRMVDFDGTPPAVTGRGA